MSRNFQVLKKAEMETEILAPSPGFASPPNGKRGRLNLEALSWEEATRLAHRVFLLSGPSAPRVVILSGVEHGCGTTELCARLARALVAQVEKTVCLVDASLRTPSLNRLFDMENFNGLTDLVEHPGDTGQFVRPVEKSPHLWLLSAGRSALSPHALLRSGRLQQRIAELRSRFDYLLIDSPPINLYADAIALGQLADGVILVVEANVTRREAARKAKLSFQNAGVRVLGAILNKRTFHIPEALYSRL